MAVSQRRGCDDDGAVTCGANASSSLVIFGYLLQLGMSYCNDKTDCDYDPLGFGSSDTCLGDCVLTAYMQGILCCPRYAGFDCRNSRRTLLKHSLTA